MISIQHSAPNWRTRRNIVLAIVAAVVLLCAVAISATRIGSRRGMVSQLARAQPERSFAPRLSIPTRYHDCDARSSSQDTVPREKCAEKPDEGRLVLRKFVAAGQSAHPDSLQASALAGLIWWDGEDASLDAAIEHLNTALRLSPNSVPLLVDLSAAHMIRAERTQNSRDLAPAIEFAYLALSHEPRNDLARFNVALALEMLGLNVQAGLAWDAFLAVDSTSPWAEEAQRRKRQLIPPAPVSPPGLGASHPAVESFAQQYPQQAREHGFDRILGEWGSAVQEGNHARADSLLDLAEALGQGLEGRGGDLSLADAVDAIRAASPDAAATLALAQAHQAYAEGQAFLGGSKLPMALAAFRRVIEGRPRSPVLLQWASIFQAAMTFYVYPDRYEEAKKRLGTELPNVDSIRHPALAGRARRMLGSMLQRDKQISDGRAQFAKAVPYLERAGESKMLALVLSDDAEGALELGDTVGAYTSMHRLLRTRGGSSGLHTQLMALGRFSEEDELPHTAWAIYNEDIALAARPQPAINELEVHLARARVRGVTGDSLGAAQDMAYAAMWQDSLPADYEQKEWARAQIRMARPEGLSSVQIDSVVKVLSGNPVWYVRALIWRADLRLDAREVTGATEDLHRITDGVRRLMWQQSDVEFRAAMMEQARSIFDRLVMLQVLDGKPDEALRTLEAGRMSFAPRRESRLRPGRLAAPPGEVAVEYALVGDTLLTWTISDSIRLWIQPVDRDVFKLTVEQANAALELTNGPLPRQALRQLYDWLIRPIRPYLNAPKTPETPLVIMADGEVARVPFPVLMNGDRRLIEDHPLRLASTLEDAARRAPRSEGPVLLVANPEFDLGQYPTLDPLPWASAEVDSLAPFYPGAVRLGDSTATRDAFVARMRSAGIIHYAGHAVFDDTRPERSYLLLAGDGDSGRLTADSISTMRLQGTPLVVLSACSTLRSRAGRSGGFAGLSGALLAAGAGGVMGSLWEVDDKLTQPLMEAFHRHYLRSGDPARALRDAQLDMLRSENPAERSPAVWAGFRYTGS